MSAVDRVIELAGAQLGEPYVFGDEGPDSFDCSGLVQYVFGHVGIKLPRTAREQQRATKTVTRPLPGDLVFYNRPATHVGIYIGGGKMINAPRPGARVRIDTVGNPTNYGRVGGLGTLAAVPIAGVGAAAAGLGDIAGAVLGGARHVVLEGLVVGLGLGLVGYGLWRATAGVRRRAGDQLSESTGGVL
jgi:hypothetical protein